MTEIFGRERLEAIRDAVIQDAGRDGRKWLDQHGPALAEASIDYVQDALTFASDGRLAHLALNPKYHAEWLAMRRGTTEKLEGVLARRVEFYRALETAGQVVINALKTAIFALLAL